MKQLTKKEKKKKELIGDVEKSENDILKIINKGKGESENESKLTLRAIYHDLTKEIKDEISKVPLLLNEKKVFEWDLDADEAFDFEFYFSSGNPSNISHRLSKLKGNY